MLKFVFASRRATALMGLLHRLNPFSKHPHLAVIFVEYARKEGVTADQTFGILQQYLSSLKGCKVTYLRVDNRHEDLPPTKTGNNIYRVGGDNSAHEFSGWQRGINKLAAMRCHYDLVLITNDMFLKPGPSFLQDYATPELLKKSLSENKIIGRIDSVGQNYTLFGYDVSSWVCTNCVLLPKKAVDAIGNIVLINDNIHEIFPHTYPPRHRIKSEPLSLTSGTDHFHLECDLPAGHGNDIRIKFETTVTDQASRRANESPSRTAIIKEISLNNQAIPENCLIRGLVHDQGDLWSGQSFLLELPADKAHPSHLIVKGCLPPVTGPSIFNHEVSIVAYNDALLYQNNAPINKNYQRWLVEWLTERWHSRFEIDQSAWELFKTKAAAIFNEALLTAKLRELGYSPETYGDKHYY